MTHLLQKHTVDLYDLENESRQKEAVSARTLLSAARFDLFAKLFYIRHREINPKLAKKIYEDHILAFNPDGKEPGRMDKNGTHDFVETFDHLIGTFQKEEFDPQISLIPVDKNNIPLDGSHRIAALAYFDRKVSVLRFPEVQSKAIFDYSYFLRRGLSIESADQIAGEILNYIPNLHIACLWPKMGNAKNKEFAFNYLKKHFSVYYSKTMRMSLEGLSRFIYESYKHQDWVGGEDNDYRGARSKAANCYAANAQVQFVLFEAADLEEVLKAKDAIREHYRLDKHALHITDDLNETQDIIDLIFTEQSRQFQNSSFALRDRVQEFKNLVKNVYWLNFKVGIAKVLKKIKA